MESVLKANYWGDEVFPLLSWFNSEKVKNAKVMVVGAGALGNEVLKNLALFGIGNIIVVDFDRIEKSNLCRSVLFRSDDAANNSYKAEIAANRLKEINPTINVKYISGDVGFDVGLGLFNEMDVVIGCLDNRLARYFINRNCFRVNKPWIDGGIENMEGNVRIFKPGINCYECSLTETELESLFYRTGCPDIAKFNVTQGRVATTPISSSIIGAIQTQEALKIIHGYSEDSETNTCKTLVGRMFKYDGMFLTSKNYKMLNYEPDCLSHDTWKPIIKSIDLSAQMYISDVFQILKKELKIDDVTLQLVNNKFVYQLIPESTEEEIDVILPESNVANYIENNDIKNTPLERVFQKYIEEIDSSFPYMNLKLKDVGLPSFDILKISSSNSVIYVELTGDRSDWF